jgi:hypothetical protein
MDTSTNAILETADRISRALGHENFGELRANIGRAAVLFMNLGNWAAVIGAMPDNAFKVLLDDRQEGEREQVHRKLLDLETYLPSARIKLVEQVQKLAPSLGGRPHKLKDREQERQTCREVLKRIGDGLSEPEAKKQVAIKREISPQTMNRIWDQRTILMNELSASELLDQVLSILAKPQGQRQSEFAADGQNS